MVGTWQVTDQRMDIAIFGEDGGISRAALDDEIDVVTGRSGDRHTVSVTTV